MPERAPTVGFIGLGRMGLPMARNLLRAGFPVVVYNRTAAKAEPLVSLGAVAASSVGALAGRADVVCACLDRVETSELVFLGPDGVSERARPGTLVIDHGTIGPETARTIARGLAARELDFLDAPVSGGPEGAEQGALTIMAVGEPASFERGLPVMRSYGRNVVRMGAVGAGSLTKLVNQLLCFVHGAVAAEGLAFAERAGLDLAAVGRVMAVSFGQSRMLERTLGRVLAGDLAAGAALRLYGKDLGLVEGVAETTDARLPLTRAAHRVLEAALGAGLGESDLASLIQLYRGRELE